MSVEQDLLEQRERCQKLLKQLEGCPETEITGVVSASGVGGSFSRGDDLWTLLFSFSGWKQNGGTLQKSELTIRKQVPEGRIASFQNRMNAYDVVRIRARLSEDSLLRSPQALLMELIESSSSDAELCAYAEELQRPVQFHDQQFGVFTLDRRVNWYEATPDWCGGSVRLTIRAGAPVEMEKSLAVARRLWVEQEGWQRKVASCAIKELLELKNDTWLDNDEPRVSEAEFARKMVLESISVEADGSFEFWHDDGDLFWGHSIMVSGNLTDGPNDAGIHG